ncbi:unnamed protein product [Phytomonas sp. Hart1]|nr:unnamed protein product [Phytomonas sp. Hart1]|eukprot:CCW70048.1 unnamed protein product [Phytomonas sp. isolate Hart1]
MTSELDDQLALNDGHFLENRVIGKRGYDIENPQSYRDLFFDLSSSLLAEKAVAFSEKCTRLLKRECSKCSTTLEDIYRNRSHRLKLSLDTSRKVRELLSKAIYFFQESIPSSPSANAFDLIALLSVALAKDPSENARALLKSFSHEGWYLGSPNAYLEIYCSLRLNEDDLSYPLRHEYCAAKFDLALRTCRLSPILDCLLFNDAKECVLAEFKPPKLPQKILYTEESLESFLFRSYALPASVKGTSILCSLYNNFLTFFVPRKMICYEMVGLMEGRLQKIKQESLELSLGEQVVSCIKDTLITVQPISTLPHAGKSQFYVRMYDLVSKKVSKSGRLSFCGPNYYLWSSTKCLFSFCSDTLVVLRHANSPTLSRRCLHVCTVLLDKICANSNELAINTEGMPLMRNPFNSDSNKALYFTKATSVSVGRVTLKGDFAPFCIELWVYPCAVSEVQTLISIGDKRVDEIFIEIEACNDGVIWRGGARTPRLGQSFAMFTTCGKAYLRQWSHVGLNFTGTTWELWLNDRFVTVQSALLNPQPIQDAKCILCKNFVGFLSEVRIWSCARSAIELMRDANERLEGTEKDLCGYYRLDEGGGDFVTDYSPIREHVLIAHGELHWCGCPSVPIASLCSTKSECLIPDFVPLSQKDDFESLHFSVSPCYFTIAVATRGPAVCLHQYDRTTFALVAQTHLRLTGNIKIIGIWWNSTHQSTQCCGIIEGAPDRFVMWEIGEYNQFCFNTPAKGEYTLWSYGREVLLQSAKYAQPYLNSERFLMDGISWRLSVPILMVDANLNTLQFLLKLAKKAIDEDDKELAHAACVLLHMNLLFRQSGATGNLTQELDPPFSDAFALLTVIDGDKSKLDLLTLRNRIVKLAFSAFAENSGLLEICCYCFLSESCRIQFIKSTSGRHRMQHEEKLFWCLVGLYQSLRYCHEVYERNEHIETLFKSLILESAFQVDVGVRQKKTTGLKQVSRCLELLQEILFDKIVETPEKAELKELCINYTKSLLRACEKITESARKTLQNHPKIEQTLLQCLKLSPIGSLLTSFTLSLPFLPTFILVTCQVPIQECQAALLSVTRSMSEKVMWMSELCIAMTFSLCLVGCMLSRANSSSNTDNSDESKYTLESKYLNIMRGGARKCGTERDLLIKNIQQGVGPIGIVFEKLQLRDNSALRMVRDEKLKRVERCIMAAICALTLPTSDLKKATPESLEPAFQHVLRMRPYIISRRQESKENLAEIEARANFFAQFEPCCVHTEKESKTTQSDILPKVSKISRKTVHKDVESWRRLFKNWKAMRLLKTLTFSQEENDSTHIGSDIVDFLQSSVIKCADVKKSIEFRTRQAHYRLSGLLILKQLIDEARVNASLSYVILPVISKNLCAWHYGDGVECCPSEDIFRLHGSFFQLFDAMLNKYLDNGNIDQQKDDHRERYHWGVFLLSLIISLRHQIDFRKVRSNLVGRAFRSIMKDLQANGLGYRPRVNGILPTGFRETKLDVSLAAANIKVGESGLTVKANGGRGSCLAPCKWTALKNKEESYVFYYEVYVVDLLPGAMCAVGVGPFDCRLFRLPGWEANSFSLLSDEGVLFSGKPTGRVTGNSFGVGDVVGCGWNVVKREIYWTKNGSFLLSTSAGETVTFSPVVGLDGKGIVQVNFGNSPFCFDAWHERPLQILPIQYKGYFKWSGTDAWDAYRAFSLRATTCLHQAALRPNISPEALNELALCVEHCLGTLSEEVMYACKQAEGAVRNPQSTSTSYLRALLRHCGIITQLLTRASRKYISPSRVIPLADVLEIIALSLIQPSTEVERSVSLVSLASLMDSDILMVLLTTWYHTMNLVPPDTYGGVQGAVSFSLFDITTSRFLPILLGLASRLCIDNRLSTSKKRDSATQFMPPLVEYLPDGVYWMALALLQHLNSANDKSGKANSGQPGIETSSPHAWSGVLDEWMRGVLSRIHQPNRDVLLILSILGGGPRLAVPGDVVNVIRTKRTVTKASLINISIMEEVCEVVEDQVYRVLPLRLVDLIIADDESNYYPTCDSVSHQRQAIEVLSLALRLIASGSWSDFDGSALLAHLLSVLWRCTVRRVIDLPKSIIAMLSLSVRSAEAIPVDFHQLRMDKVLTESCCAGMRHPTSPLFLLTNNTSDDLSSTFEAYDLMSPINFTGPQWHSPAYSSDHGVDIDDEEHGDNIDTNEGEDMSDEILSSMDNLNLGASFSSDNFLKDEYFQTAIMRGAYDAIRFDCGYLCVRADRCIGLNYTLNLQIYIQDLSRPQIIFAQSISDNLVHSFSSNGAKASDKDGSWLLIARIVNSSIEYGIMTRDSLDGTLTAPLVENICRIPLTSEDTARWIRLTFVGSATTHSLYREGVLRDIKRVGAMVGSLFQHELFFGGFNMETGTLLRGCLRGIRIYDVAMNQGMVEQLQPISFSLLAFTEPHLCLIILAQKTGFKNYSRSPVSISADITAHGDVSYLENSVFPSRKGANFCAQELDYGNNPDEENVFMIETSWLVNFTHTYLTFIKSKRELSIGQLWVSYRRCLRQLITFYSISILAELLYQIDWKSPPYPEWITAFDSANDTSVIKDILQYTFITGNDVLYGLLQNLLQTIARSNEVSPLTTALCRDALQSLLQTAQCEQSVHIYESPHPLTPSLPKTTREISFEGQNYYQFFFDSRSSSSNIVLTFSMDKMFSSVFSQTPGFALTSFTVQLPRVYFDVRITSAVPQWGYKMFVVSDCLPQLRAVRLIRTMLTTALECEHLHHFPFLKSGGCLKQMSHCAMVNTGKTRRIILSCLSDLLLSFEPFDRADMSLLFSTIHEIRRMAERRYRQNLTAQLHVTHCRFLQVAMECYTFFMDAWRCWGDSLNCAVDNTVLTSVQEQMLFAQRRLEQRMLYRFRDNGKERVTLQKSSDANHLHLDWTADICVVRNDGGCASMIAQVSLTRGKWYFEVRIGGTGNSFIGVLPSASMYPGEITRSVVNQFAFNGFTGLLQGADKLTKKIASLETWQHKDYVGVVLDMDEKMCRFLINGKDVNVSFSFGGEEGRAAAAAAWAEPRDTESERTQDDTVFFPYFELEKGELMFINFGASHFEYEVPCGCLPLDPANLMLGALLPYNHLRAFQDLLAHLLTGGSHPMPPFYYEEADPFAHSIERKGSAHVSLHSPSDGVEINVLEAKNTGTGFQTVTADCSVLLGCWYYEVTLHTQGLMQIGWIVKDSIGKGSVGDIPLSWSIDLFRRMRWHKGIAEPLVISRRWSVGDVIGCALNLSDREMTFFLNGRSIGITPLTSCTFHNLPVGPEIEYVPAISLRAGNHVSFNFGSSPFKCKPDGFSALGVSDSWCERIDTFYSNERPSLTLRRMLAIQQLCRSTDSLEGTLTKEKITAHLQSYRTVVEVVNQFCQEPGKVYTQITQESFEAFYKKYIMPPSHTVRGESNTNEDEMTKLWNQFLLLKAVARLSQTILLFLNINTQNTNLMTMLFLYTRNILFRQLRINMVDNMLKETNVHTQHLRLSINRMKARLERQTFQSSVFGQTLALLMDHPPLLFQSNKRFWSTTFMGEGAEDVGGPFREHINEICQELMSTNLPLFVPTANHVHNLGKCRDAFVPAASATGQLELAAYVFLGNLMGGAIRSEEPLSLFFPPLVWKYMCSYPIMDNDLDDVDRICWQCIHEFQNAQRELGSKEAFNEAFDTEYFVTKLSDTSTKELIENGANIKVTYDRCGEYAEALLKTRLHEFDFQLRKIREGMLQVVPELVLLLLSPEELEMRVCGQPEFEISELRKSTVYEGLTSEDRRVLLLWSALEEATPRQRSLFLRFVSGRDRMPVKLRVLPLPTLRDPNTYLPRAATCFFALELPDYRSLEVMKEKLYYCIENCLDIDTDFNARQTLETEGPRLVVGINDVGVNHHIEHSNSNSSE